MVNYNTISASYRYSKNNMFSFFKDTHNQTLDIPSSSHQSIREHHYDSELAKEHMLTEGPLEISAATVLLENLMRKLMQTGQFINKLDEKQDIIFIFDDIQFNWSDIIREAHLEHIVLTELDFTLYQNYMENLKQNDLIDEDELFAYLPTIEREKTALYQKQLYKKTKKDSIISFEEMSAINIYTGGLFFSSINDLIRGDFNFFDDDSIFISKSMEIRHAIIQLVMCANGLNKFSIPDTFTTYRGETLYSLDTLNERINAADRKNVILFNSFVSTNIEKNHPYTARSIQYTFHNVRGLCVAPISRFTCIEQEVIMLPTQIQLVSYTYKNQQHFFEGKCVRELNKNDNGENSSGLAMSSLQTN